MTPLPAPRRTGYATAAHAALRRQCRPHAADGGEGPSAAATRTDPPPGTLRCGPLRLAWRAMNCEYVRGLSRRCVASYPGRQARDLWGPRSDGNVRRLEKRAAARVRDAYVPAATIPLGCIYVCRLWVGGAPRGVGLDKACRWPREPRPRRLRHGYDLCTPLCERYSRGAHSRARASGGAGLSQLGRPSPPRSPSGSHQPAGAAGALAATCYELPSPPDSTAPPRRLLPPTVMGRFHGGGGAPLFPYLLPPRAQPLRPSGALR